MSGFVHPTQYVKVESIILRHALSDIDASNSTDQLINSFERWVHLFEGNERTEFLTYFSLKYEE